MVSNLYSWSCILVSFHPLYTIITHHKWLSFRSCSDCDFLSQAAPWIQSNVAKLMDAQKVNCRLNGQQFSLVYMNGTKCSEITALSGAVEAPETYLPPYFPLVLLTISAIVLLIGSVFVAVCRKRNSLRIWAVGKCPLNHCYQTTLDDDHEKLYDAYVAYRYVINHIFPDFVWAEHT